MCEAAGEQPLLVTYSRCASRRLYCVTRLIAADNPISDLAAP